VADSAPARHWKNLVKEYHSRRVVNDVSISVGAGEIVGLLGPNGRGQDDDVQHGRRSREPDGGVVNFKAAAHGPAMHRRARLGIGYLTQEPSVFRKLTVEENILAILRNVPAVA